ncbi:sulfatase-like hydrolase/transferase [Planctomycetota bacterium]
MTSPCRTAGSQTTPTLAAALWCLGLGVILTAARVAIVAGFGWRARSWDGWLAFSLGVPGLVVGSLVLALLLYSKGSAVTRGLAWLLLPAFVLCNLSAFHYEAVFDHLPAAGAIRELTQWQHVGVSLAANAPLGWLVTELVISCGLLWALHRGLHARIARPDVKRRGHAFVAALLVGGSLVLTLAVHSLPQLFGPTLLWAGRTPVLWLVQTATSLELRGFPDQSITRDDVRYFQERLGQRSPTGGGDVRYPLRATAPRDWPRPGNGRSVIVLILESVGTKEVELAIDGHLLMPNLRAIAREGLFFPSFLAAGTKSLHALPSMFAGQPPQTTGQLLWRSPLNNQEGLPRALGRKGYRSAYFHGGHLDFDNQRPFLKMVGFDDLVEPDALTDPPFLGWGIPDEYMFQKLRLWIEQQRSTADQPFFAVLATVTSHDPWLVPDHWKRRFGVEAPLQRFYESLRYVDHHLAEFYAWYRSEEAPKGTALVITGDHVSHLFFGHQGSADSNVSFLVPLIIAGQLPAPRAELLPYTVRRGAMFDLPATLCGLLDIEQLRSDQGLDLLRAGTDWPTDRFLYSVAGESCEEVYLFTERAAFSFERPTRRFSQLTSPGDNASVTADTEAEVGRFLDVLLRINAYLYDRDGYAPPATDRVVTALSPVARPIVVSLGGQVDGARPAHEHSTVAAIEEAVAAGFEWVEVDVDATRDGVPLLVHSPFVLDQQGQPRRVATMSLAELRAAPATAEAATLRDLLEAVGDQVNLVIRLQPQKEALQYFALGTAVAKALLAGRSERDIIVDSPIPFLPATIQHHTGIPGALSLSERAPLVADVLETMARSGLGWVRVHHSALTRDAIRTAHRFGIRVMATGVNDMGSLEKLMPELPDGVVTNRVEILRRLRSR